MKCFFSIQYHTPIKPKVEKVVCANKKDPRNAYVSRLWVDVAAAGQMKICEFYFLLQIEPPIATQSNTRI